MLDMVNTLSVNELELGSLQIPYGVFDSRILSIKVIVLFGDMQYSEVGRNRPVFLAEPLSNRGTVYIEETNSYE